jgi:hypothetical protein
MMAGISETVALSSFKTRSLFIILPAAYLQCPGQYRLLVAAGVIIRPMTARGLSPYCIPCRWNGGWCSFLIKSQSVSVGYDRI